MKQEYKLVLQQYLESIEKMQSTIVGHWTEDEDLRQILHAKEIDVDEFRDVYASGVVNFFIDIIKEKQEIGQCPVIKKLIILFEAKSITTSELYVICIRFRETIISEMIKLNQLSDLLYEAISYILDLNFKSVLQLYTDTVIKAKEEKNEFQSLVENSMNEIYIFDTQSLFFVYCNNGAIINSGYSAEELLTMNPTDIKPYYQLKQFKELISPLLHHKQQVLVIETVHQRKDGSLYPVYIHLQLMNFRGKEHFVAVINDVTTRNEALEEKEKYYVMATHDYLTKIYNRQNFDTLFLAEAKRSQRYHYPVSIILFDIDNFKSVNDTYGHETGDQVLVAISSKIKTSLRDSDVFARWGGEEFIILLPYIDLDAAMKKAHELRDMITLEKIDIVDHITCSFGVAQVKDFEHLKLVFREADNALYEAKKKGKNRVESSMIEMI